MFSRSYSQNVAAVHTLLGFTLLALALWHVINNFKPLKQHLKHGFTLCLSLTGVVLILILTLEQFPPFAHFLAWGSSMRVQEVDTPTVKQAFTTDVYYTSSEQAAGQKIILDFRHGASYHWPQYAFWLEELEGDFVQALYVSASLANNYFINKVSNKNSAMVFRSDVLGIFDEVFNLEQDPSTAYQRFRHEALPVFLHKLAVKDKHGRFVSDNSPLTGIDGYSGATAPGHFVYHSQSKQQLSGRYRLRFEVNQSFDFNDYYSSDRFPDDPVYSGSGYSAQPSLIYESIVDFDSPQQFYVMKLVGRGHHSGEHGRVINDLNGMDSALNIVERVIVELASER
ncbi:hypothetical protein [Agaribacterium haliotis]|uniref:hypothetical protein n=1 Tax=Agaribacterium haliotis TaxID=2013869 RepID=UPI0011784C46|nr:hypothetical protein [Agaribacterium haliotis]